MRGKEPLTQSTDPVGGWIYRINSAATLTQRQHFYLSFAISMIPRVNMYAYIFFSFFTYRLTSLSRYDDWTFHSGTVH